MRALACVVACFVALGAPAQIVGGVVGSAQTAPPPPPPPPIALQQAAGANAGPVPLPAGTYRISGTVVDGPAGTPLSKAIVVLTRADDQRRATGTVTTGADGHFLFDKLAAGKYNLSARRKGYPLQGLNEHEGFSTAVVIGADLPADPITFRLRPDAILTGRITDDANEPVANAQVMLFRADVSATGSAKPQQVSGTGTNYDGEYRFSHLRPGNYLLAIMGQPWYAQRPVQRQVRHADGTFEMQEGPPSPLDVTYPLTFYPGATEESGAAPIQLQAGDRASVDLSLHAIPAVHVKVRLPANDTPPPQPGQPPPPPPRFFNTNLRARVFGTEVYIPVASMNMGGNGSSMDIGGVAPGHYILAVNGGDPKAPLEARQEVDAGLESEVDVTRNLVSPVSVSGMLQLDLVADARTARPANLRVQLFQPGDNRGGVANVSADGQFDFPQKIGPGRYQVRVFASNAPVYLKSVSATGGRYSGGYLEVGSSPVKLTVAAAQGYGLVDGLAEREGKGMPGAMVVLVPEDPVAGRDFFRRDQSDSDGTFTLRNVVPGKYTVIVVDRWDIAWQDPEVLRKYLPHGQPVEVTGGGKYKIKTEVQ